MQPAIGYSCSGPVARASGVTYDLRKDEPYLVYPELDFEVPYSNEGDCWARFIVRMEEREAEIYGERYFDAPEAELDDRVSDFALGVLAALAVDYEHEARAAATGGSRLPARGTVAERLKTRVPVMGLRPRPAARR